VKAKQWPGTRPPEHKSSKLEQRGHKKGKSDTIELKREKIHNYPRTKEALFLSRDKG